MEALKVVSSGSALIEVVARTFLATVNSQIPSQLHHTGQGFEHTEFAFSQPTCAIKPLLIPSLDEVSPLCTALCLDGLGASMRVAMVFGNADARISFYV